MNHTVPLRSGSHGSYASLGNITQGTRVMVLGASVDGNWTHIQVGEQFGWVLNHRHNRLLEHSEPHPAAINHTVPLRSGSHGSYASLGNVTQGTSVIMLGTSADGSWTHIQVGARVGWVLSHRLN